MLRVLLLVWLVALSASGCTGFAEQSNRPRRPPNGKCAELAPGPSPLRRLTRAEFSNTVADLLNDQTRPGDALPSEQLGNGFGNDADGQTVSRLLADQYFTVAEQIAERATSGSQWPLGLLGCDPATSGENDCADLFVRTWGARAYRRPLETQEVERLLSVYNAVRAAGGDLKAGIQAIIQMALQAPQFLYRVEFGAPLQDNATVARVGHYEMASRLSYFLWGTMPDQVLFEEARAGRLGTPEEVRAQTLRMLDDPRAHQMVMRFHHALFAFGAVEGLRRNVDAFPTFTPEVASLLRQETEAFVNHVVWQAEGDLKTLLAAPYTFMNEPLARYYGVSGVVGEGFQKVSTDSSQRLGLLTQGSVLAVLSVGDTTSPTRRGLLIRRRLFCDSPPDPPPGAIDMAPADRTGLSSREFAELHTKEPQCAGCHRMMDPLGFGLENFDAVGLWRTTDNGQPVDARGEIFGTDVDGPFDGAVALVNKLASSSDVQSCYATHWTSFAYGRTAEGEEDSCNRESIMRAFEDSGFNIRDLIVSLTQTDAFLYRQPVVP